MTGKNVKRKKQAIDKSMPKNGSKVGRPTRAESEKRHEELLERALDVFLEHGFEGTTIDDIAAVVGMSKRTVYSKYDDKAHLFKAAVRRAIDRYTVPIEALRAVATDDLEQTLLAIARIRIANVSTPSGIKLQRILTAQAYRFPELFNVAFELGTGPTIDFLSELFAECNARGEINVSDTHRAAVAFLSLVVGGPARIITSGNTLDPEEVEERIHFTLNLFLNGIRSR